VYERATKGTASLENPNRSCVKMASVRKSDDRRSPFSRHRVSLYLSPSPRSIINFSISAIIRMNFHPPNVGSSPSLPRGRINARRARTFAVSLARNAFTREVRDAGHASSPGSIARRLCAWLCKRPRYPQNIYRYIRPLSCTVRLLAPYRSWLGRFFRSPAISRSPAAQGEPRRFLTAMPPGVPLPRKFRGASGRARAASIPLP